MGTITAIILFCCARRSKILESGQILLRKSAAHVLFQGSDMSSENSKKIAAFQGEVRQTIAGYSDENRWKALTHDWMLEALSKQYVYNFSCLGRPIIQLPTDMVAFQEIVWDVKPDLIIETGIAHGGSLIQSASLLAMIEYCEAVEAGVVLDPTSPKRRVIAVDIDIREHNRQAIEAHPMAGRIDMIEGSSTASDVVAKISNVASKYSKVLVSLDSNHTHEHVLEELAAYAPLTSKGSYCLVFDTIVEDMPDNFYPNRPWHPGNSPKSAVHEYLAKLETEDIRGQEGDPLHFENNLQIENKLFMTVAPAGFLKRK